MTKQSFITLLYSNSQWIVTFGFILLPASLVILGELILLHGNVRLGFTKIPFSINDSYLLLFISIMIITAIIMAILGLILLIIGICSILIASDKKKEISVIRYLLIAVPVAILIVMFIIFALVMFFDSMTVLTRHWFGIDDKEKVLRFIGWGMGGMVIALNGGALNRRASAQEENNELVGKGNDDARFQSITENLGHSKAGVRIATFYRFYYYASKKGQSNKFRSDIFEILCSYLRTMPKEISECEKKKEEYRTERQTLFDILFKEKFKSKENGLIPDNIPADLQRAHLDHMDLTNSNLSGANLSSANLSGSNLSGANLTNANLTVAHLNDTYLLHADLLDANLSNSDLSGSDFWRTNLSGADLSDANLSNSDLRRTQLKNAKWQNVYSLEKADFRGAKIGNRPITKDDIPEDKGEYYADWNSPPEKEEN